MPETSPQPDKPPQPARRWKRTAAAALLLLVGGAIVNVAVAWGCAWNVPAVQDYKPQLTTSGAYWGPLYSEEWQDVGISVAEPINARTVSVAARSTSPSKPRMLWIEEWTFGWPAFSMGYKESFVVQRGLIGSSDRGIESAFVIVSTSDGTSRGNVAIYPLRPLVPGFIINTLFYALLLWLLFFAPFAARRMLRRRRGQCEKCAYPIGTWGGSPVCTECGAAVPTLAR